MMHIGLTNPLRAARRRGAGLVAAARRLCGATQGVAAVEFAFILPILLALLLGGTEVTLAVNVSRKVVLLARTLGDITGQFTTLTSTGMNTIFTASSAVMQPYPTTNLNMVVSSILVEQVNGNQVRGVVAWSCAKGPNAASLKRAAGSTYTPPAGYQTPNTSFILAEVKLPYEPKLGSAVTGTINLNETTPWPVRNASPVAWSGAAC